jgi:HEAT repeat protein
MYWEWKEKVQHANVETRLFAIDDIQRRLLELSTLDRFHQEKVLPLLLRSLKDKDSKVRAQAAAALIKTGKKFSTPVLMYLFVMLKDPDSTVRCLVSEILGELKDRRATRPLQQALEDKEEIVRQAAAQALQKIEK